MAAEAHMLAERVERSDTQNEDAETTPGTYMAMPE